MMKYSQTIYIDKNNTFRMCDWNKAVKATWSIIFWVSHGDKLAKRSDCNRLIWQSSMKRYALTQKSHSTGLPCLKKQ